MQEIWKDAKGYEGIYQVSNTGKVLRLEGVDCKGRYRKGQIMKPKQNNRQYWQIRLYKDGKTDHWLLHRLVAVNFIDNPDSLPQVNHKDENKDNNCVDNLEWCDNTYNRRYGTGIERMAKNHDYKAMALKSMKPVMQFDLLGNMIGWHRGIIKAQEITGINGRSISHCACGKYKTAGGYKWKFASQDVHISL